MLKGKRILLGVTGGIAAYKSALLVREMIRQGAEVQVVMTRAATQFITPLTLSTLSRREAIIEMFPAAPGEPTTQWTKHIDLGLWADIMIIAPASANTMAKIAHGFADNMLTTLVLALRGPLLVAPAMDVDMWLNAATQTNVDVLRARGVKVIEPESGELASGLSGPGRLPEIAELVKHIAGVLAGAGKDFDGKRILVTAGPTQEPLDPVRYLGNRSSGKMGFAIAAAAAERGAYVTLVSGPVALPTPQGVHRINVVTAREMFDAVMKELPGNHAVVMAAAVADFAPARVAAKKIKRDTSTDETITLELKKNPDILRTVGEQKTQEVLVGFALETDDGPANAKKKLDSKRLDLVVLNDPTRDDSAFGADTNVVTIIHANGTAEELPKLTKRAVADKILDRVRPLIKH